MKSVSDRLNELSDSESQKTVDESEIISLRRRSIVVKCTGLDIAPSVIPKLDGSRFRVIFDLSDITRSVGIAVIDLFRCKDKSWSDIILDQRDSTLTLAQPETEVPEIQTDKAQNKKAWIDIDSLVDNILCNEVFRNSLENDPFNHQQVHPHLFGIWNQSEFGEQFDLQLRKPTDSLSVVSFEAVLHQVHVNQEDIAYLSRSNDGNTARTANHPLANALKATELHELERIFRKSRKQYKGQQQLAALNHLLGKQLNVKKKLRHQTSFVQRPSQCSIESYKKKQLNRDSVCDEEKLEGQKQMDALNQVLDEMQGKHRPSTTSNATARDSAAVDKYQEVELFDFRKPQLVAAMSDLETWIRDAVQ
jgi:hypothetical protein